MSVFNAPAWLELGRKKKNWQWLQKKKKPNHCRCEMYHCTKLRLKSVKAIVVPNYHCFPSISKWQIFVCPCFSPFSRFMVTSKPSYCIATNVSVHIIIIPWSNFLTDNTMHWTWHRTAQGEEFASNWICIHITVLLTVLSHSSSNASL